jgi:hypothetical protein
LNEKLKKAKRTKDKKIIEKEIYTYLKKRKAERYFNIKVIGRKKKGLTIYQINWEINEEKLNRYNFTFREFVNKVGEVKAVELEVKNVKKTRYKIDRDTRRDKKDIKGFKYGGFNV